MSRHGLPLAIVFVVFSGGCQNPWHSNQDYSQTIGGLEQPDALIKSPRAMTARYADSGKVQTADHRPTGKGSDIQLASAEEQPATSPNAGSVEPILKRASAALVSATEATGDERAMLLDQAKSEYLNVLLQQPGHAEVHHRLGVVCDLQEEFAEAEEHYRAALAVTPHNTDLLSDIGYSYQLQDRPEVAEKFFRRVLRLDPKHPSAASNLGRMYAERGDYDEARSLFVAAAGEAKAMQMLAHFFPQGDPQGSQVVDSVPVIRAKDDYPETAITAATDSVPIITQRPARVVVVDDPGPITQEPAELPAQPIIQPNNTNLVAPSPSEIQNDLSSGFDSTLFDEVTETNPMDNGIDFDRVETGFGERTLGEAIPQHPFVAKAVESSPSDLRESTPVHPGTFAAAPGQARTNVTEEGGVPRYPSTTKSRGVPWRQLRVAETYGVKTRTLAPPATAPRPNPVAAPKPAAQPKPVTALPGYPPMQPAAPVPQPQRPLPKTTRATVPLPASKPVALQATQPVRLPTETIGAGSSNATGQLQKYPYGSVVNEPVADPAPRPPQTLLQRATPLSMQESQSVAPKSTPRTNHSIPNWPGLRQAPPTPTPAYPKLSQVTEPEPAPVPQDHAPLSRPVYQPVSQAQNKLPSILHKARSTVQQATSTIKQAASGLPVIRPGDPEDE